MEFDDLLITTGVDNLVKLVKQKGRVELSDCASALNLSADTLEEWARILEEEGIIKVEYKLTKIYLVWVQPTEEKIKEESEALENERLKLLKELDKVKSEVPQEIKKIDDLKESFSEIYSKFSGDVKNIEEKISPFLLIKEGMDKKKIENKKQLEVLESKIDNINNSINNVLQEIEKTKSLIEKSEVEGRFIKIKKTQDEIYQMMSELKELRKSMEEKSAIKAELPSAYELKKKFDLIARDFAELKNRNAALKEDLISLKEGKDIVDNVGAALKDYEKTTVSLQKELSELTKEADSLFERVKSIDEKVRESFDTINRFSDSLNVAKGIVSRFPNQEKLRSEQENILKKENELEQKVDALKKLVELAGGVQVSAREAEELVEKLEERINNLKEESFKLSETLEEEKNRYFTFQQIRERILPSLRSYQNDVIKLKSDLDNIKKNASSEIEEVEKQLKSIELKLGKEDTEKLFKVAKEIEEKKRLLSEINAGFDELAERANNLNKRLSLLTNQAKLLSIKAAPTEKPTEKLSKGEEEVSKELEEGPEYFKKQLQLTKEEEKEFAKKREELRKLIEKLWEEEKPKKK